jgi:hypothetical protein
MKPNLTAFVCRAALIAPVCFLLGGCLSSSPIWDAHFGEAARATTQAQIINPHAGEQKPSTSGVDGRAAVSSMNAYNKSFQSPSSGNPFVIGNGGGVSGGGTGATSGGMGGQ